MQLRHRADVLRGIETMPIDRGAPAGDDAGMTTLRRLLVDPENACDYHLVSRCVKGAFLCDHDQHGARLLGPLPVPEQGAARTLRPLPNRLDESVGILGRDVDCLLTVLDADEVRAESQRRSVPHAMAMAPRDITQANPFAEGTHADTEDALLDYVPCPQQYPPEPA